MIVGAYTMELYCDSGLKQPYGTRGHQGYNPEGSSAYPDEFVGQTAAECRRQARAKGWRFLRGGYVLCPACARLKESRDT